ncbi:hypothetical protein L7F22_061027 [Adiantum nelumboides]|nr:hypothetical protein [Adiantum nelumboides]
MAMQARQDWGTGMLKLQPHQGAKKGKAIHIDLRAGKHESLDLGTSVDEFSSSKYFTSREKSIVTEYSDSSQAKIMEVMITNPAMVSSNNILQVKEGFLVDGYNQITGAFMVHINKQQVMPQMLATTFAKFSFVFLLKTFVNVTMEGSLSLVLWHWVLFAHVSKWVAPLQGSNYTMQTWSSIGLVGMLTHECYEEKIKLASLQAGQGKEVVLLGETHSPNLDGVYTLKLNKATIEIVIYNEKEAKLFGVNLVVDRFMFSDALLSAKQVKIPWICGSQSLVSQDWKEVKLVKKIIGTQPLLTKEIQGVSTTTSEPPYYEVIANKKLLQGPLSQQRKHWLDTMRLREIEAFPEDPNNRRRWLIRKATRYKNRIEFAFKMQFRYVLILSICNFVSWILYFVNWVSFLQTVKLLVLDLKLFRFLVSFCRDSSSNLVSNCNWTEKLVRDNSSGSVSVVQVLDCDWLAVQVAVSGSLKQFRLLSQEFSG